MPLALINLKLEVGDEGLEMGEGEGDGVGEGFTDGEGDGATAVGVLKEPSEVKVWFCPWLSVVTMR